MGQPPTLTKRTGPSTALRAWAIAIVVAYLVVMGVVLMSGAIESGRAKAAWGIGAAVPLIGIGVFFSMIAVKTYPSRVAAYWRIFGFGCAVFTAGIGLWTISVLISSNALAIAASLVAVASMPLYTWALYGRIKSAGGVSGSSLDLFDILIVLAVLIGYVGYFLAPALNVKRGYAVTVILCGGLILTGGALYTLVLLLRRGGSTVRRSDRYMLLPFAAVAAYTLAADIYLTLADGPTSAWLYFGALLALAPLPLTPLIDVGSADHAATPQPRGTRTNAVVVFGLASLIPLVASAVATAMSTAIEPWRILYTSGTVLVVAALIAARMFMTVRENRALTDAQESLARNWKREAARAQALLLLLRRVVEGKELAAIVDAALDAVIATTGAVRACFLIKEGSARAGRVVGSIGLSEVEVSEIDDLRLDPVALFRAYGTGRSVTSKHEVIPQLSETSARFGANGFAAVAITGWEQGGLGALCCDSGEQTYAFTVEDVEMIEAIVDHVGLDLSRNRLFKELAASEERYRMLVEDATDGVCELDLDDRILFSNSAFAEMVALPLSSLPGKRLEEVVTVESDKVRDGVGIRELIASAERDGETAHLEVRTSVRRDGRVQAVARDVTERLKAAERIETLYAALEQKEQARTEALAQLIRATEDERSRVAADLHDGPVQELSTLAIRLDLARTVLKRGQQPEAEDVLTDVRKRLSQEVLRLRHLMMELRPPVLDERGLYEAIDNYARTFELETGIPVHVAKRGEAEMDKPVETVLYRITQEALANVRKHSMAREVEVSLSTGDDGNAILEISDDGIGFDLGAAGSALTSGHIGLASMRERAELAGGRCEIESGPGRGTVVRVSLGSAVVTHAHS